LPSHADPQNKAESADKLASNINLSQSNGDVNRNILNVTQSKQFKRWFGDWQNDPENASKVVNEDGTPKVVYHGTSNGDFNVFDTYGSNFGLFGYGSYFTEDSSVAESYTKKGKGNNQKVYECYLDIKKPIDMDNAANIESWINASDIDDTSYFDDCKTNEDCFKALKEYCQDNYMNKYDAEEFISGTIQDMGYDGITHIGGGRYNKRDDTRHRVWIAFEPTQVKSATDNVGTFDRENPDIRYAVDDTISNFDENIDLSTLDDEELQVYNKRGWRYNLFVTKDSNGKVNTEDLSLLQEKFSELNSKNRQRTDNVLADGTRVVEVNNKLVLIGGTYEKPQVYSVLVINSISHTKD
jgi:hypothetical protein